MIVILNSQNNIDTSVKTEDLEDNSGKHIAETLHIAYNNAILNKGNIEKFQKVVEDYLDSVNIVEIKNLKQLENDLDTVETEVKFLYDIVPNANHAFDKFKFIRYIDNIANISNVEQRIVSKKLNKLLLTENRDLLDDNLIDRIRIALRDKYITNKTKLLDDITEGCSDYRFASVYEKIESPVRALQYCMKSGIDSGDMTTKTLNFYRKNNILTSDKTVLEELSRTYVHGFPQYTVELVNGKILSVSQAAYLLYSRYLSDIISNHIELDVDPIFFMSLAELVIETDNPLQKYSREDLLCLLRIIFKNRDKYLNILDRYIHVYKQLADIAAVDHANHRINMYSIVTKNIDIRFHDILIDYIMLHIASSVGVLPNQTVGKNDQAVSMEQFSNEMISLTERYGTRIVTSLSSIDEEDLAVGTNAILRWGGEYRCIFSLSQRSHDINSDSLQEAIGDALVKIGEFIDIDHDNCTLAGSIRSINLTEILNIMMSMLNRYIYIARPCPSAKDIEQLIRKIQGHLSVVFENARENGRDVYGLRDFLFTPLAKFLDVTLSSTENLHEVALEQQNLIKKDLFKALSHWQQDNTLIKKMTRNIVQLTFAFSITSFIKTLFDMLQNDKLTKDFYDSKLSKNGVMIISKVFSDLKPLVKNSELSKRIQVYEKIIELISHLVRLLANRESLPKVLQNRKIWETMTNTIHNMNYDLFVADRLKNIKDYLISDRAKLNMERQCDLLLAGRYDKYLASISISTNDQIAIKKNCPKIVDAYRDFIEAIDRYIAKGIVGEIEQLANSMQSANLTTAESSSSSSSNTKTKKAVRKSRASRTR